MINIGSSLRIAVLCPDCDKPMTHILRTIYPTLAADDGRSDQFASLICDSEDCINNGFISTIEKKSGMVLFSTARYIPPPRGEDPVFNKWKPVFTALVDAEGNAIDMKPKR